MQFGHPVGARSLKADDGHEISSQFPGLECREYFVLAVEHQRRRFDDMMLGLHCRGLDDRPAEIAGEQPQAAVTAERIGYRPQYVKIAARRGCLAPGQLPAVQPWLP